MVQRLMFLHVFLSTIDQQANQEGTYN